MDLSFGWRTAVLTAAIVQVLAIAVALMRPIVNRHANRTLALLLIVLVGILMPWTIGFAGFYDRWRWLTFAPFAITLAVAPLLWLYATTLVDRRWPPRAWRHLMPAAAQFLFLAAGFLLPMPLKEAWADRAMSTYGVVAGIGTVAGLAWYGLASLRLLRRYRESLAGQRSDDTRFAAAWLSRAIGAALVLLPIWATYAVWDAIAPLGYINLMGLHLAIAAFALYLAVEGWRHAALPFPVIDDTPAEPIPARDWTALGEEWAARVRAEGWARDPDLSLATMARHLGTNTSYLSRALNEGLGTGFSAFVNAIRSETVAAALRSGDRRPVLDLALEAGFASKASFNRAFQARFGQSPTAYRRASHPE